MIRVYPTPERRIVRDPDTGLDIRRDGTLVRDSAYWWRMAERDPPWVRIERGDEPAWPDPQPVKVTHQPAPERRKRGRR